MAKTFTADTFETAVTILTESDRSGRAHQVFTPDQFRGALNVARELERLEAGLRRRSEYACNFPMTEAEGEARERKDDKAARRVADILKPYRIGSALGGDVRGSQVHLLTPRTGRANTFGGREAGWAV